MTDPIQANVLPLRNQFNIARRFNNRFITVHLPQRDWSL
jgi:hypothetical protein